MGLPPSEQVVSEELVGELSVAEEFWEALEAAPSGSSYAPVELPGVERF